MAGRYGGNLGASGELSFSTGSSSLSEAELTSEVCTLKRRRIIKMCIHK
jgi:hypothetical protein